MTIPFFDELVQALLPRYGAGEARALAQIVFEDVFNAKNTNSRPLNAAEQAQLDEIKARLVAGEPLQYILGMADFFGLKFKVSPAVLIPRQETEELVDWALKVLKKRDKPSLKVLDIGLGSGCIGLTIQRKMPALQVFGIEKSRAALDIARENAVRLLGEANPTQLLRGDILTDDFSHLPLFDLIVSNPPYIPYEEVAVMPEHVLEHEPALALFVQGSDALLFYRKIALFAQQQLVQGGQLLLECNEFNATEVADLLKTMGFEQVELKKDLSGADRMVGGVVLRAVSNQSTV